MSTKIGKALIAFSLACSALCTWAQDQAFPSRPLQLVVPFPPGGAVDAAARLVAKGMSNTLHQTVVVDNRSGAAGTVGTDYVAKSRPQGYILCWCPTGPLTLTPLSDPGGVPYKPLEDLLAVSEVVKMDNVIMARRDLPAKSLKDMQALSLQQGREFTFGTPGAGGTHHLGGNWLSNMSGIKLRHIPYKGEAPAISDLLGGQIDLVFGTAMAAAPLVASGKIRILANLGTTRSRLLPDVPTVAEAGFPGYGWHNFVGINVAAGTPPDIVSTLAEAARNAVRDPAIQQKLKDVGMQPVGSSPAEYTRFLQSETATWQKLLSSTPVSRQ